MTAVGSAVLVGPVASARIEGPVEKDWIGVVDRLLAGDRLALLELNRLISGFLTQLRAYDFRDEWDDLRQEVLLAVVANARAGRLRERQAFLGYVRIITRNKFFDRLKAALRRHEKETLPWDDATARALAEQVLSPDGRVVELWAAVRALPDEERRVVEEVYGKGRTYEETCRETGLPLGTMKRRLRDGLATLRRRFGDG